ncbi:hypothetical protein [Sphingomonas glaciei]|uniref:Uncharacterized protein n=1 Tax=Sphingomonas glaciei TaxID=2938948 RepID=A0ABY5MWA8_9SPHN|nr:hypothetical protein [Sphingomonas glaciei]UUR07622.1 hypothetical protein M1K48_11875 [Sphingomonas glaciei]
MQTLRSILGALAIVSVIFGVPVAATLLAGQFGLSFRLVGWLTLLSMIVLTFQARSIIGRLLVGERKLAPALVRRRRRLN